MGSRNRKGVRTTAARGRSQAGAAAQRALARVASMGWRTTDEEEIRKRNLRAQAEPMEIRNLDPGEGFFSNFAVASEAGGMVYAVEIRSLTTRDNSCTCTDNRVSRLGTCKHIEAVLEQLRSERPRKFRQASAHGSPKAEIFLKRDGRVEVALAPLPAGFRGAGKSVLQRYFTADGTLRGAPEDAVPALSRALASLRPQAGERVRISREVIAWAEARARLKFRETARRSYFQDLEAGKRSSQLLSLPLYPYQEEGMLHLAFGERMMLADEMGLGKTVQAIAACVLLRELRGIERVLVVSPASLKTEWEEQIQKFTDLPLQILSGNRTHRCAAYRHPAFFNLTNYEQVLRDVVDINRVLSPDVVILDEAQRIKNWSTKTAQAVKRLASPFAFVLTGTPLENRIDEIYSIVEFLDPSVFGPLFRFNREFYVLDDRGRPQGYQNLEELRRRARPLMLRRRKDEVEEQLPERVDNNYFVEMAPEQISLYTEYQEKVARLASVAKRRPLTKEEMMLLMKWLACMRMLCDTTYILNPESRVCPKLPELANVIEDLGLRNGRKALIFSEWARMLELVRDLADEMGLGYAWHTGSVPQTQRRREINRFKNDPDCNLFLSTDSGGVGLNLQAASVVINLDLPWNPARLEQRIARAWRKNQRHPVNVVNLISQNTIEHRMLATLALKRDLAAGIVDGIGDLASLKMSSGREAFLERLRLVMGTELTEPSGDGGRRDRTAPAAATIGAGAAARAGERFRQGVLSELSSRVQLLRSRPGTGETGGATFVVVDEGAEQLRPVIARLHRESGQTGDIEVLDRRTFETLERLAALGLIVWPEKGVHETHRSPALKRAGPAPETALRREAERLMGEADRKAKMVRLLAEGRFHVEAVAALKETLETTLRALMCAADTAFPVKGEPAGEAKRPVDVSAVEIQSRLVAQGILSEGEAAHALLLRGLAASPDLPAETAEGMIGPGLALIESAGAALARAALSDAPSTQ